MRSYIKRADGSWSSVAPAHRITQDTLEPHQVFNLHGTFWTAECVNAPVASNSAAVISNIVSAVTGDISFNTWQYTPPMWIVSPNDPIVTFQFDNPDPTSQPGTLFTVELKDTRIPRAALPAKGSDAEIVLYDPVNDTVTDLWHCTKVDDTNWKVGWGGRILNASKSNGIHKHPYGTAASGLAFIPGIVHPCEIRDGFIPHTVGIALPVSVMSNQFSAPATRTDGTSTNTNAIMQGQRLRLKASYDVENSGLHPVAKIIARAAQTYGLIVWDQGSASIRGMSIDGMTDNQWNPLLKGNMSPLAGFPLDQCEVIQKDWMP